MKRNEIPKNRDVMHHRGFGLGDAYTAGAYADEGLCQANLEFTGPERTTKRQAAHDAKILAIGIKAALKAMQEACDD